MTQKKTIEAGRLMMLYGESVQAGRPITIECRCGAKPGGWIEAPTPIWDWHAFEYRERPTQHAPKYRPYATVAEVPVGAAIRSSDGKRKVTINDALVDGREWLRIYVGSEGCACSPSDLLDQGWVIDATGEPAGVKVPPEKDDQ